MIKKFTKIAAIILVNVSAFGHAMNLLHKPYDTLVRPEINLDSCFEVAFWAERGTKPALGFNSEDQRVNVLQIYNPNQDALAMLEGFPVGSPAAQLLAALNATDDGVRGHIVFNGNLNLNYGGVIGAWWFFLPHAWITAYLPVYSARLDDITITDLTQMNTAADFRVKQLLTNNLQSVVATLGNGLSLARWKRTGLGDLNIMAEWLFDYPQERPCLKNVELTGRFGFTFPTGLRTDPDKLFAFPFGYDGAIGLLFAGGLAVDLTAYFRVGFDIQLLHLFGNTRTRRIKTAYDQSDLLLLAKTPAYTDYGLTQRFNLFAQVYHIFGGLSVLAGYQFLKHGRDHLALNSCDYSSNIANSALSLDDWIAHSIEVNVHYDFPEINCVAPQISVYTRIPFNGRRSALFNAVGVILALDF